MSNVPNSHLYVARANAAHSMSTALGRYFVLLLVTILFVPKVGLYALPGFSVMIKPEDILWICALPMLLFLRIDLRMRANVVWLLLLTYLLVSCIWFPGNILLDIRLFFYSIPLLYGLHLTVGQAGNSCKIIRNFLYIFALVAVLQVTMPFPGVNSGEWYFVQAGRAPGIFTNGVEFALVAYFAFWLAYLLGERSIYLWVAALVITLMAGTRFALVILILCGLVYVKKMSFFHRVLLGISTTVVVLAFFALFQLAPPNSRWEEISISGVLQPMGDLFSSLAPSSYIHPVDGYCFEFDDSLAPDRSLAMRLSKLKFVIETVVIGENPLGFGLGNCLGDSGDNLYVRILSDGGMPFLVLVLTFFSVLMRLPLKDAEWRKDWHIFFISFLALSCFYDTLFFSRVAPLVFAIFAVVAGKLRTQRGQSAAPDEPPLIKHVHQT